MPVVLLIGVIILSAFNSSSNAIPNPASTLSTTEFTKYMQSIANNQGAIEKFKADLEVDFLKAMQSRFYIDENMSRRIQACPECQKGFIEGLDFLINTFDQDFKFFANKRIITVCGFDGEVLCKEASPSDSSKDTSKQVPPPPAKPKFTLGASTTATRNPVNGAYTVSITVSFSISW